MAMIYIVEYYRPCVYADWYLSLSIKLSFLRALLYTTHIYTRTEVKYYAAAPCCGGVDAAGAKTTTGF